MISAKSFAPANVSCIFGIRADSNPRKAGSIGVGFCLNEGAAVKAVKDRKTSVKFNGKIIDFPTVNTLIESLTSKSVAVEIISSLPLGCGFGLSGASALATAYALNKLFNLKKSKLELAVAAHTAEVINGTGLGDVSNQYCGGFCVKLETSANFAVRKLPIAGRSVYCRHFSPIDTKSVIQNSTAIRRINSAAGSAMKKIKALIHEPGAAEDFSMIIKISKQFAIESGLLASRDAINTIDKIERNKGNASMIMLGNAVFSNIKFDGSREFRILEKGAFVH